MLLRDAPGESVGAEGIREGRLRRSSARTCRRKTARGSEVAKNVACLFLCHRPLRVVPWCGMPVRGEIHSSRPGSIADSAGCKSLDGKQRSGDHDPSPVDALEPHVYRGCGMPLLVHHVRQATREVTKSRR